MDLGVHVVERDPVAQVAVQAIGLLDEDDVDVAVAVEEVEHLHEVGAAGALGGLDVDELALDVDAVGRGVVSEQLLLGRDREALLLLLGGRDPCVQNRLADDDGGGLGGATGGGAAGGLAASRRHGSSMELGR